MSLPSQSTSIPSTNGSQTTGSKSLHSKIQFLESELTKRDEYITSVKEELVKNMELRKQYTSVLTQQKKELETLKNNLSTKSEDIGVQEQKVAQTEKRIELERKEIEELKKKLDAEHRAREKSIEIYEQKLKSQLSSIPHDIEGALHTIEQLNAKSNTQEQKIAEQELHIQQLTKHLEVIQKKTVTTDDLKKQEEKLNTEIIKREAVIHDLKNEIEQNNLEIEKKRQELTQYQKTIHAADKQTLMKSLVVQKQIAEVKKQYIELAKKEKELESKAHYSTNSTSQIKQLEKKISTLNQTLIAKDDIIQELKNERNDAIKELNLRKSEFQKLVGQNQITSKEKEKALNKINELNNRIQILEKTIKDQESQLHAMYKNMQDQIKSVKDTKIALAQKESELNHKTEITEASAQKLSRMIQTHEEKEKIIQERTKLIDAKERELQAYKKQLLDEKSVHHKKVEQAIRLKETELINGYKDTAKQHDTREKTVKQLEQTIEIQAKEIIKEKAALEALSAQLAQEKNTFTEKRNAIIAKIHDLEKKEKQVLEEQKILDKNRAEFATMKAKIELLFAQAQERELQTKEHQKNAQEQQILVKKKEQSIKKLEEDYQKSKSLTLHEHATLKQLQEDLTKERKSLGDAQAQLKQQMSSLQAKEKTIHMVDKATLSKQLKAEAIIKQLEQKEKDFLKKQEELTLFETHINNKKVELDKQASIITQAKNAVEKLKIESVQKSSKADAILAKEKEIIVLQNALHKKEQSLQQLNNNLAVKEKALNQKQEELSVILSETQTLKTELEKQTSALTQAKNTVEKLKIESVQKSSKADAILAKEKEVIALEGALAKKESVLQKLHQDLNSKEIEIQKVKEKTLRDMLLEKEQMQKELALKEADIKKLEEKSSFLKKQADDIKIQEQAIAQAKIDIKSQSLALIKKKEDLDKAQTEAEHKLSIANQVIAKEKDLNTLQAALDKKHQILQNLEQDLQAKKIAFDQKETELVAEQELVTKTLKKYDFVSHKEVLMNQKDQALDRIRKLATYLITLAQNKQDLIEQESKRFAEEKLGWLKREEEIKTLQIELDSKKGDAQRAILDYKKEIEYLTQEWNIKEQHFEAVLEGFNQQRGEIDVKSNQLKEALDQLTRQQKIIKEGTNKFTIQRAQLLKFERALKKKVLDLSKKEDSLTVLEGKIHTYENDAHASIRVMEQDATSRIRLYEEEVRTAIANKELQLKNYEAESQKRNQQMLSETEKTLKNTKMLEEKIKMHEALKQKTSTIQNEIITQESINKKMRKEYETMQTKYKQLIFDLKMKEEKLTEYENTLVDRGTKVGELIEKLNRKEAILNKKEAILQREFSMLEQKKWKAYVSNELGTEAVSFDTEPIDAKETDSKNITKKEVAFEQVPVDVTVSVRKINDMISDTKRLLVSKNIQNAKKMIVLIENNIASLPSDGIRKRLSYDVLELKTDIKLASL